MADATDEQKRAARARHTRANLDAMKRGDKRFRGQGTVKGGGKATDYKESHALDELQSQDAIDRKEEEQRQREEAMQQQQFQQQALPPGWGPYSEYADVDFGEGDELPIDTDIDAGADILEDHAEEMSGLGYTRSFARHDGDVGDFRRRHFYHGWERGRLGFMANLQDVIGQQVLSFEADEKVARAWTLNMVGHRYTQGPAIAVTSLSDGPPSTNQLPFDNETQGGIKFAIEWGVSGGLERAIVDYPWAGISLSLVAASIRIFFPPRTAFGSSIFPQVGGFLTPKGSFQQMDTQNQPTNTIFATLPAGASTTLFTVPTRARAYRWYLFGNQGATVSAQLVIVEQCSARAGVVGAISLDNLGTAPQQFSQRQLAIPLSPNCQVLQFTNPVTNLAMAIAVEFLLDLG